MTLIVRINGRRYIRPYSFSSAPSTDALIELTIKRVQNGIVSNHIHDTVKIGDAIEVMEPMGEFTFDGRQDGTGAVYFWGAGSGITPLISLIKDILASNALRAVHLIYGNRNAETTIFLDTINALLEAYPGRFKAWHFHTQLTMRVENPFVVEGRINRDLVLDILKGVDVPDTLHYICGPVGLKESVKEALSLLNVQPSGIFSEDFELIKDPKDFEDIHTRSIKLRFEAVEYALEVTKGRSVLEAALDAGLELPYSCQTGNCSTCKASRLDGEVRMIGLAKERSDLAVDQYLLCCCYPLTDNVIMEI